VCRGRRPAGCLTSTPLTARVIRSPTSRTCLADRARKTGRQFRAAHATVTQTLWDGNRTANSVRAAESSVLQARETMRYSELTTCNRARRYMDVLRDRRCSI